MACFLLQVLCATLRDSAPDSWLWLTMQVFSLTCIYSQRCCRHACENLRGMVHNMQLETARKLVKGVQTALAELPALTDHTLVTKVPTPAVCTPLRPATSLCCHKDRCSQALAVYVL